MRRQRRETQSSYKFFYISGGILIILVIALVVLYGMYNKKLNDIAQDMLPKEPIIGLVPNITENETDVEKTSSDLSKTIDEAKDTLENKEIDTAIEETNETITTNNNEVENTEETKKEETKKELEFAYPVEGEIIKEFAIENLIYSKTLEEWTVHQGIDIKADRTTVVKAAEEGTVVAIKNDPRYGLTVIIEHEDGYKTVYSNLLVTDFVAEDEKVEKGQSIGTVGNSAVFEIADEPHLHFELTKDGEYLDPKLYVK